MYFVGVTTAAALLRPLLSLSLLSLAGGSGQRGFEGLWFVDK